MKTITALFFSLTLLLNTASMASYYPSSTSSSDQTPEGTKTTKLLAWDGGGIRGLFSLYVAKAVDKKLGGAMSLVDEADVMAGTSTGGIIALMLAKGGSLQDCIDLYENDGQRIFQKHGWWTTLRGLVKEKYNNDGLIELLKENLGEDTTFADLRKPVVITAYDTQGGAEQRPKPRIFSSYKAEDQVVKTWEAAYSTAAAPTYFEAYGGFRHQDLVDGGVCANNPCGAAYSEIFNQYPIETRHLHYPDFKVLSLGTGVYDPPITDDDMGQIDWAPEIAGTLMRANSQMVELHMNTLFGDRHVKINHYLKEASPLDAVAPEQVRDFVDMTEAFLRDNPGEIDRAAKLWQR